MTHGITQAKRDGRLEQRPGGQTACGGFHHPSENGIELSRGYLHKQRLPRWERVRQSEMAERPLIGGWPFEGPILPADQSRACASWWQIHNLLLGFDLGALWRAGRAGGQLAACRRLPQTESALRTLRWLAQHRLFRLLNGLLTYGRVLIGNRGGRGRHGRRDTSRGKRRSASRSFAGGVPAATGGRSTWWSRLLRRRTRIRQATVRFAAADAMDQIG